MELLPRLRKRADRDALSGLELRRSCCDPALLLTNAFVGGLAFKDAEELEQVAGNAEDEVVKRGAAENVDVVAFDGLAYQLTNRMVFGMTDEYLCWGHLGERNDPAHEASHTP